MFSGIIEDVGVVKQIAKNRGNIIFGIQSKISNELKVDQSVSHNGVCLTVTNIFDGYYTVTAINETLQVSNLKFLKKGSEINLERSLKFGERIDGHLVQGHIDQVGKCIKITEEEGSWIFTFEVVESKNTPTIYKGSIAINGVSLTICEKKKHKVSVAIIPYTYNNTTFKNLAVGGVVNIEFDVLGKYLFESKNGQKWAKMAKNEQKMAKNEQKMVKNGQKWAKMTKKKQFWKKFKTKIFLQLLAGRQL